MVIILHVHLKSFVSATGYWYLATGNELGELFPTSFQRVFLYFFKENLFAVKHRLPAANCQWLDIHTKCVANFPLTIY